MADGDRETAVLWRPLDLEGNPYSEWHEIVDKQQEETLRAMPETFEVAIFERAETK